ncbi:MAG TPA: hypothetical protein PLN69_05450 [bacterium]|nr:hypothetical protein [bacterium]
MKKALLFLLVFCVVFCAGKAVAEISDCTLENEYMKRVVRADDQGLRTVSITNKLSGTEFKLKSQNFRLILEYGKVDLTSQDFALVGSKVSATECVYELENAGHGIKVEVDYTQSPNEFWTRKKLVVDSGGLLLNEIEVERFEYRHFSIKRFDYGHESKPPWHWPGGRPLFVDRQIFMGLEYPAGYNEEFTNMFFLHHYPGRSGIVESKPAIIGVASGGINDRVDEAFARYLDRIRYKKPRRFIMWNGYFNMYQGDNMADTHNKSILKKKFSKGVKAFTDAGVQLDCLLMDGGWAESRSLMEEDSRAPGRVELVRKMSKHFLGAPIGLHVIAHGIRGSIDKEWLKERFDMIDDDAYCFADNRAADLQMKNLAELMKKHKVAAYKFDWGRYTCRKSDHRGHIYGERYAREAITDNQIRQLTLLHETDPESFLYNTGWYSPWWLMHYEAVFSGEDDYNVALVGPPSLTQNDLQVTWRDSVIYRDIVEPETQFPLSALMNHAPINWHWNHDFEMTYQGPLDSFSNAIVSNFMRGNGLIEFYYNVFLLKPAEREIWGRIEDWARNNDETILAESRYFGGMPFDGDVYGYAHFRDDNRGIISARNPLMFASQYSLKLDEKIGFNKNGAKHYVRISYPYEKSLGSDFVYGDRINLELDRGQVLVLEVEQAGIGGLPEAGDEAPVTAGEPTVNEVSLSNSHDAASGEYIINTPAGTDATFIVFVKNDLYMNSTAFEAEFRLNGEKVSVDKMRNCMGKEHPTFDFEPDDGWTVYNVTLPEGESSVSFDVSAPDSEISGWIFTQNKVAEEVTIFEGGLPSVWASMKKKEINVF